MAVRTQSTHGAHGSSQLAGCACLKCQLSKERALEAWCLHVMNNDVKDHSKDETCSLKLERRHSQLVCAGRADEEDDTITANLF